MEKQNEIIRIYGRVQGVGFRYSARQTASAIGLTGFVRNEDDGSVTIEAEGSRAQIDLLVEWCRKGPSRSDVKEVRHFTGQLMNYKSFIIK